MIYTGLIYANTDGTFAVVIAEVNIGGRVEVCLAGRWIPVDDLPLLGWLPHGTTVLTGAITPP